MLLPDVFSGVMMVKNALAAGPPLRTPIGAYSPSWGADSAPQS